MMILISVVKLFIKCGLELVIALTQELGNQILVVGMVVQHLPHLKF